MPSKYRDLAEAFMNKDLQVEVFEGCEAELKATFNIPTFSDADRD